MMFDALTIARGWLAIALASSNDKARPQLHRTIHIEQHAHGVRLVATDSYVILHCFVPELDHEDDPYPELDEAPISTATAIDPHGRAKGFLAHALKLATAEDAPLIEIKVRLNVVAVDRTQGQLGGMEARSVVVEMPDVERLILEVYDGSFPEGWRDLLGAVDPVATARISLDPDRVGQVAKIGKIHPTARLGWTFCGPDRAAYLEVIDSFPFVNGLVMPCAWDFRTNSPIVDDPPPAGDDEQEEAA